MIQTDRTYCNAHDKKRKRLSNRLYDEERMKHSAEYVRFYNSKAWRNTRRVAMVEHYHMCVHCLDKNIYKQAQMVDHIIPVRIDWNKRLDLNNLQALCYSCHAIKTEKDKKIF